MQREVQDNIDYIRLKNYAIGAVANNFPEVEAADIKQYFAYLEKYCEIINDGLIPIATWKSMRPCSAFSIRNKLIDFFNEHRDDYKEIARDEVMKAILGEEEWNKFWNEYEYDDENDRWHKVNPDEESAWREVGSDGEESPWHTTGQDEDPKPKISTMEEVDGGSRRKSKRKRKSKSKSKSKLKKTNKNKTKHRARVGRKKSYKVRK